MIGLTLAACVASFMAGACGVAALRPSIDRRLFASGWAVFSFSASAFAYLALTVTP